MENFLTEQVVPFLQNWGAWAIFIVTFLECSFFFGLVIPGETVIVTGGILASQGIISPFWAFLAATVGAISGDNTGYFLGKFLKTKLWREKRRFLFFHTSSNSLARAKAFFEKYGDKAVFFGRYLSIFRSFLSVVAGAAEMRYTKFFFYDLAGALTWSILFFTLGFFFGNSWETFKTYFGLIGLLATLAFLIGLLLVYFMTKKKKHLFG
ncbi:hypothetical protein COT40_00975 [Candidatus Peregrinibacteria bacterium CG08_land_8_20_14_0_20_41_10]|nr:MAG: hypothetical protein COT40_00975 [Candidatus Peregrinibacteria bacterium CG08_land_8_20_14_0_20_41_10]